MLETYFTYLWEGYNVMATWCHGCSFGALDITVPMNSFGEYTLKKQLNSARRDVVLLIIHHIVSLGVLETTFIY